MDTGLRKAVYLKHNWLKMNAFEGFERHFSRSKYGTKASGNPRHKATLRTHRTGVK